MIAEEEQIGTKQREVIEAAALVHDIGIHAAEKKYRSAAGEYQEQEGPPIARAMLMALEFSPALTNRVKELVAHHHSRIGTLTLLDLHSVEADFLVNAYEGRAAQAEYQKISGQDFPDRNGNPLFE